MSSGLVPNLRHSPLLGDAALWKSVVLDGARRDLGMMGFSAILDEATAEAIRAYVIGEANSARDAAYYRAKAGTETRP